MSKILFYFYLILSTFGFSVTENTDIFEKAFDNIYLPKETTETLELPEYNIIDGTIVYYSYASSNKEIISNDGVVTPGKEDTVVIIYCKAEVENKTDMKTFFVKVPGKTEIPIYSDLDEFYLDSLIELTLPEGYNREDFEWVVNDDSLIELDEEYFGYLIGTGNAQVSIYKDNKCYGTLSFEILPKIPNIRADKKFVLIGEEFDVKISNYKDESLFNIEVSDESVVKYADGKFVAKGEGLVTITYTLKTDERISKSIEMQVYDNSPIIKVYNTEVTVGSSLRIYVENYKNDSDFKVELLDEELGEIDGAKLIAKKAGIATLKVSLTSDPNVYSTIDIKINNVLPNAYALNPNIIVGGTTYLSIKNIDDLVVSDFEYINKTPDIASLDKNVVTGLKEGKAIFEVKSKSMAELSSTIEVNVMKLTNVKLPNGEVGEGPLIVSLEGNKETYKAGEKIKVNILGATDLENYKLVTSDNSLINTLEDGHIITKAEGRATVIAINKENEEIKGQVDIIIEGIQEVDYIERLIATAESQIGYRETADGLTKYGIWYGIPDGAWCAMFVTWCAHNSGISTDVIPFYCGCTAGMKWFVDRGQFGYKENYIPKRGDIIFFLSNDASHTGIVTGVSGNTVYTIEGNTSNMCARRSYSLDYYTITGYGIPKYE